MHTHETFRSTHIRSCIHKVPDRQSDGDYSHRRVNLTQRKRSAREYVAAHLTFRDKRSKRGAVKRKHDLAPPTPRRRGGCVQTGSSSMVQIFPSGQELFQKANRRKNNSATQRCQEGDRCIRQHVRAQRWRETATIGSDNSSTSGTTRRRWSRRSRRPNMITFDRDLQDNIWVARNNHITTNEKIFSEQFDTIVRSGIASRTIARGATGSIVGARVSVMTEFCTMTPTNVNTRSDRRSLASRAARRRNTLGGGSSSTTLWSSSPSR